MLRLVVQLKHKNVGKILEKVQFASNWGQNSMEKYCSVGERCDGSLFKALDKKLRRKDIFRIFFRVRGVNENIKKSRGKVCS